MMEARYTSVMRSTRSGNYYNVPIAPEVLKQAELSPELSTFGAYDAPHGTSTAAAEAAAWGTAHMRRLPTALRRQDLNATLAHSHSHSHASQAAARGEDVQTPQPAFALDLNQLVAALTKDGAASPGSSFAKSPSGGEPEPEPVSMDDARRQQVLPVEPTAVAPRPRSRRDALAGDEPPRAHPRGQGADNSLISYSLNKRKQKRLAARALQAASASGPNFEYVVADAGKEYQPQYVPRYMPQYQAAATGASAPATPLSASSSSTATRPREISVDQESYTF